MGPTPLLFSYPPEYYSSSPLTVSLSYLSILENIKNATKGILKEMDSFLTETEEVEKTFIRCRANTQKESQRMESVEPDVNAATQRESHKFILPLTFIRIQQC